MRVALHPQCAWVSDDASDTVYALRLPGSQPLALQGVAAIIFGDIADGLDPIAEAIARWPEGGDEVATSTHEFVETLITAGLVQHLDPPATPTPAPTRAPARALVVDRTDEVDSSLPDDSSTPVEQAPAVPNKPFRVLFVCTANICRSAYADVIATAAGLSGVEFSSAGTHGWSGRPMDPPMAAVLPAGVDGGDHRGRQVTRAALEQADLVVAMADRHRSFIQDEWPTLARKTFVIGQVARELGTLPAGATPVQLVDHLWRNRTQHPSDSVADPYQRGPEAAQACATRLDADVSVILERLSMLDFGGPHE